MGSATLERSNKNPRHSHAGGNPNARGFKIIFEEYFLILNYLEIRDCGDNHSIKLLATAQDKLLAQP